MADKTYHLFGNVPIKLRDMGDGTYAEVVASDSTPVAGTAGGATPGTLLSAASTNATLVKNSAGTIYPLSAVNYNTTSMRHIKLYDKATAPDENDVPKIVIAIPKAVDAESPSVFLFSGPAAGQAFALGIGFRIVAGKADNDTTAVGAGDVRFNYGWK